MINSIKLKNFGPFREMEWGSMGGINLITGVNGSGKTYLLKAMYSAMRSLEEYYHRSATYGFHELDTIVPEKLDGVFSLKSLGPVVRSEIGSLMTDHVLGLLSYSMLFDDRKFSYKFGHYATNRTSDLKNLVWPRKSNSVFLPSTEVLSLGAKIMSSRDPNKTLALMSSVFGFDDTYLDIIKALFSSSVFNKDCNAFCEQRKALQSIVGGRAKYHNFGDWEFERSDIVTDGFMVSDGFKKVAALDVLLGNQFIGEESIIFIDEIEAGLHPRIIMKFLDVIFDLATCGIQFFISSNSYVVLKKLALLAKKNDYPIYMLECNCEELEPVNLESGLVPDSEIDGVYGDLVSESISLDLRDSKQDE